MSNLNFRLVLAMIKVDRAHKFLILLDVTTFHKESHKTYTVWLKESLMLS